jgi:Acetyltransferase (GNAT) domain
MTLNLEFKAYSGESGLKELESGWKALESRINNLSYAHTYYWYQAYIDNLSLSPKDFIFFTAYRDDKLVAIIPLQKAVYTLLKIPFRCLSLPQNTHFLLPDIILDSAENKHEIIDFLYQQIKNKKDEAWAFIFLPGVLTGSVADQCLSDNQLLQISKEKKNNCDLLPVIEAKETLKRVSKNFRGNLKKARNKLKKMNHSFIDNKQDIHEAFETFLKIESSGWKGAHGKKSAIALHPHLSAFYKQLVKNFSADNECEINILEVEGTPVAAQFAIVLNEEIFLLKIGYDEHFKQINPGQLMIEHILEKHHAKGLIKSINLISDAKWHDSWVPIVQPCYDYFISNTSLSGYISRILFKFKHLLKKQFSK